MREHPILGKECRSQAAYNKLLTKWNAKPPGEKQQLSIDVLEPLN